MTYKRIDRREPYIYSSPAPLTRTQQKTTLSNCITTTKFPPLLPPTDHARQPSPSTLSAPPPKHKHSTPHPHPPPSLQTPNNKPFTNPLPSPILHRLTPTLFRFFRPPSRLAIGCSYIYYIYLTESYQPSIIIINIIAEAAAAAAAAAAAFGSSYWWDTRTYRAPIFFLFFFFLLSGERRRRR